MPRVRGETRETSRASQMRSTQERQAAMRALADQEQKGMLWWNDALRPPGMVYGWIRRAVNNEQDQLNVTSRQQSGWMPVPPERHPELTGVNWGLPTDNKRSYIERAGLVLCEIPLHIYEAHKDLDRLRRFEALKMPHIEQMTNKEVEQILPMFDAGSKTNFEAVDSFEVMASEDDIASMAKKDD